MLTEPELVSDMFGPDNEASGFPAEIVEEAYQAGDKSDAHQAAWIWALHRLGLTYQMVE